MYSTGHCFILSHKYKQQVTQILCLLDIWDFLKRIWEKKLPLAVVQWRDKRQRFTYRAPFYLLVPTCQRSFHGKLTPLHIWLSYLAFCRLLGDMTSVLIVESWPNVTQMMTMREKQRHWTKSVKMHKVSSNTNPNPRLLK